MSEQVEETISALRASVGAATDAELARRLRLNQSTISSWRARGRVPSKFVRELESNGAKPPQIWGELQDRALPVAHGRYILLRAGVVLSGDVEKAMRALSDVRAFWLVLHRAVHDIRTKMDALNIDLAAAQMLILQADLSDPEATATRVRDQIEEDLRDNPWLANW